MSHKNELFTLQITDMNPDGNGVARLQDGQVVFVPLTAPGDTVRVKIIKESKSYLVGRVEELLTPSPNRCDSGCGVYKRCGGCVYRHVTPETELKLKRQTVENAFRRIGHLDVAVQQTVSFDFDRYRNKVVYPLGRNAEGEPTFGYYARHTHSIVEHTDCLLQEPLFAQIAMFHVEHAKRLHIPVWDEKAGAGILRHIAIRKSRAGEYTVCFVASKAFSQAEAMANELMREFPQVTGVSLNINPTPGNVIFGLKTRTLAGQAVLRDQLCGKWFELSPTAFYQVNAACAEAIYQKAAELAELPENGVLLDLYCGAGTIGLSMVDASQKLCGVELVPEAVENAVKNASANGRTAEDTLFVCGDASLGVKKCRAKFGAPDVIVVDPPRKGLSDEVIGTLLATLPRKIVYISCNPATLAANCAKLCKEQYRISAAIPYNMFPRTGHVESVVCLERV